MLVDGAHNPLAAKVLGDYVDKRLQLQNNETTKTYKVSWIFAVTEGEDISEILKLLLINDDSDWFFAHMLHFKQDEMHAVIQEEETVLKKELEWLLDSQLPNSLYNLKKELKELQVKFPNYNRGNLTKLTVNSKKPYFIEQLIDAQNYITLALDTLECSNNSYTKEKSYELLDTVLKYISNARFTLTCASEEKLFPYKICDPQMFGAKFPEDLVIQFHIESSCIVVSVYALQYHSSPPQQKHGNILGSSKSSLK
ncbi:2552_t:CDS:2, partial [Scutellospora calospora]